MTRVIVSTPAGLERKGELIGVYELQGVLRSTVKMDDTGTIIMINSRRVREDLEWESRAIGFLIIAGTIAAVVTWIGLVVLDWISLLLNKIGIWI